MAAAPAGAAVLAVCGLGALAGRGLPVAVEVAALAGVVAVVGWAARAGAGLVTVLVAELCLNGFRENALGTLRLHRDVDLAAVATFLGVWLVAYGARAVVARILAFRDETDQLDLYLVGPGGTAGPPGPRPDRRHGAAAPN